MEIPIKASKNFLEDDHLIKSNNLDDDRPIKPSKNIFDDDRNPSKKLKQ